MTITQQRGVGVVTGGTAGLERAVVRRLAEKASTSAFWPRGEAGLAGAAEDVRTPGPTHRGRARRRCRVLLRVG